MDALQSKGRPGSTPNLRIVATISTAETGREAFGRLHLSLASLACVAF